MTTLQEMLENTAARLPNGNFMGTKQVKVGGPEEFEYIWCSYGSALDHSKKLAKGLIALNLVPDVQGEDSTWRFLGLQSKNCREWYLLHLSAFYCGTTSVALYDTLGADAMKYIINQTEMATVALSADLAEGMIDLKISENGVGLLGGTTTEVGKTASLKNIIVFSDISAEVLAKADTAGIKVYTFNQVLEAAA